MPIVIHALNDCSLIPFHIDFDFDFFDTSILQTSQVALSLIFDRFDP